MICGAISEGNVLDTSRTREPKSSPQTPLKNFEQFWQGHEFLARPSIAVRHPSTSFAFGKPHGYSHWRPLNFAKAL